MEITLENKGKFFAQYWGQKLMAVTVNENDFRQKIGFTYMNKYHLENCHIELKPLSSITDEDAEGYLHFIGCHSLGERIQQAKIQIKEDCHNDIHLSDYLRSKGYALPWMGLSIDKLIEYGWVKLKTE